VPDRMVLAVALRACPFIELDIKGCVLISKAVIQSHP